MESSITVLAIDTLITESFNHCSKFVDFFQVSDYVFMVIHSMLYTTIGYPE